MKLPHFQVLNTCESWIRTNSLGTNTGIASGLGLTDLAKQLEQMQLNKSMVNASFRVTVL